MTTPDPTPVADRVTPRWQDPALPAADRVDLLLEQMTLEEKVAQLGSRWIGGGLPDAGADSGQGRPRTATPTAPWRRCRTCSRPGGRCRSKRRAGTGSATSPGSSAAPR